MDQLGHFWQTSGHLSPVTCQNIKKKIKKYKKKKIFTLKNIEKIGGASRWRVCYQRGLPRLVLEDT